MSNNIRDDVEQILFTEEEIKNRINQMGVQISKDYKDKDTVLIAILRGAIIFFADLSRAIKQNITLDFMVVTRYGYSDQPGEVKILKDLDTCIEKKHVLIVEDVIDRGDTLNYLLENLKLRNPASLKVCTLFDKPVHRRVRIKPDYNGFIIPDRFVVGYGLDYKQKYRNLPYLATLKPGVCAMDNR
jgi:hypoxanthine phosphoribosyltransferase